MKVLVTGHNGYIGAVLVPLFESAGHEVEGLDTYYYEGCTFGPDSVDPRAQRIDIRDVRPEHLAGYGAVIHLAALSNDPLGDLNPNCTYDINHLGSVHLAETAKRAGVPRFLFSSSCSLYGAAGANAVKEIADFAPVTPYGESKALTEGDLSRLADSDFSPTYLRNATAYGMSARLRGDLVVNNLVSSALTTGQVLIKSDGTPWRPLVHIGDISRAFLVMLDAPRDVIHNEAFNVGRSEENYQIRDIADIVAEIVPDCSVTYAPGGEPDKRSYQVDFSKMAETFPDWAPEWTLRRGVEELYQAYRANGLTADWFEGPTFLRIKRIRELLEGGRLDADLRWQNAAETARKVAR
jgi:nucleoside-diphosphate-sugar epimerase